ncbi:MAG: O-antigen ligase family protein [Armatimonadota bacterium]
MIRQAGSTALYPVHYWIAAGASAVALAVCLLVFPLPYVIGVIVALAFAVAILANPFFGAMTFIAFYYIRPTDYIPELGMLRLPLFIATMTATGLFIRLLLARERLIEGWFVKWFLAFWMVMWLSVPLATWRSNSLAHAQDFAKFVAMVWIVYMSIRSEQQLITAVRLMAWMALWLAGATIHGYMTGQTVTSGDLQRAGAGSGMLGDPNDTASVLLMLFPLCYYLFFHDPKKWLRVVYASAMALSLVAVVLTGSRGGFLGLVFLLFLLWCRSQRKVLGLFIAVFVFATLWFAAPASYRERITGITRYHEDESAMARVYLRQAALNMFKHNPLVGVGIGNFDDFQSRYGGTIGSRTAHNMYLLVLGELGALGLFVFLNIWLRSLRAAKQLSQEGWWLSRALGAGALVGLLDIMLTGYFLSISYYPYQYFLMACVAVAASRHARREREPA